MYRTGETNYPGEPPFGVQDGLILEHYGVNELHFDSVKSYRSRFLSARPDHPWNGLETKEFLYKIGAWGKLRDTGKEGLTLAGLLMFSEERMITEVLPHYFLEYRSAEGTGFGDERWTDRVTSQDGTWSGNLYEFYFLVMPRLTSRLRIPFQVDGFVRRDETDIHTALREAFVNTLIHTDYYGERGIVIEREEAEFVFANPGSFRIAEAQAFAGGTSDIRNPNLSKMFLLIGLGERAGSGFFTIRQTWEANNWAIPEILRQEDPARTILTLRTIDAETVEKASDSRTMRNSVNNDTPIIDEIEDSSNKDWELLNKEFISYNKEYDSVNNGENSLNKASYSLNNNENSLNNTSGSYNKKDSESVPENQEEESGDEEELETEPHMPVTWEQIWEMGELARKRKRLNPSIMENLLVELCAQKPLMLKELAQLTERTPDGLRNNYLSKLVKEHRLHLRYPDQINHPRQAYISTKN
ncbi:hypothetical protein DFP93_11460 [Aneurinibacillus soli]|uniref:Uncharacterized protein n=1 Tax=Aneurinibacillus soli TaxID=1500254 RepID=A0A0U5AW00_9BACL|nr:transcriptional regulator [Aneurinibacillus soli]PYE60125.1 hypothetical protein DFP93_11460 [Aneurinibacillus soli]BAU26386.1 hypothetical protein CB4_00513 [Aneurinibacillus soli]